MHHTIRDSLADRNRVNSVASWLSCTDVHPPKHPIPARCKSDYLAFPAICFYVRSDIFSFFYTYFILLFMLLIHTDLYRPLLLFLTIILAGFMAMSESLATANRNAESYLTYSTVKGYFLQDEEDTDSSRFDYVCFLSTSDNYPGGYRRLIVDRLRLISASLIITSF